LLTVICLIGVKAYTAESVPKNEALYLANCAVCHRPGGDGIEKIIPPLLNNAYVIGDREALISVVLNGRGGMPPFGEGLTTAELSSVLTYVRQKFGNNASAVDMSLIDKVRREITQKRVSDHDVN